MKKLLLIFVIIVTNNSFAQTILSYGLKDPNKKIDEIFDAIFSDGSPKIADTLSKMETNYLAELTQLTKFQRATEFRYAEEDEEE